MARPSFLSPSSQISLFFTARLSAVSLRWIVLGGLSMLLFLLLGLGVLAASSERQTAVALGKMFNSDIRIGDLSRDAAMEVMRARRYEKDFLLSYKELGFDEAKSRYATLFRATLRDARTYLSQIEQVTQDAETVKEIQRITVATRTYEKGFLDVVDLYRQLGYVDTGLEGAFRKKAHAIERSINVSGSPPLALGLLSIRRREKDYIQRGRLSDKKLLADEVSRFKIALASSMLADAEKYRMKVLIDEYHRLFQQYCDLDSLIDERKRGYLTALQTVEPGLERVVIKARAEHEKTWQMIGEHGNRLETLIVVTTAFVFLLSALIASYLYRRIIRSVDKTTSFAKRIASNNLNTRITSVGHDEFGVLDQALNQMADALSEGQAAQKQRTAELMLTNEALLREVAARNLAEANLHEANSELAEKIAERTKELHRTNEALIQDIAARKQAELALTKSEERFRHLAKLSSDWYWEQDESFRFTMMSCSRNHKNGEFLARYLGKTQWEMPINLDEVSWDAHKATLAAHEAFTDFEYEIKFPDQEARWFSLSGEPLFDEAAVFTGYRGTGRDITERKQAEQKIRHMALHDPLTGLPNRLLLQDRLKQAIAFASRNGHSVWVLFMDLDRFKFINDSLGHQAGDTLLMTISQRLQSTLRKNDTVARLGGDEFVLVLPEIPEKSLTSNVIDRIMSAVTQPMVLEGQEIVINCSIGGAVYPADGIDGERLMEHADAAMYRAKQHGRNNFHFYTPMNLSAVGESLKET